ncbi:MAG TPA: pyridoxal phosphate-dependent aminotransferase [Bacteroidota bacterium]|nr:pyridoxal phosphate-dependent aminotransferase [Bacteroidota bacterium]
MGDAILDLTETNPTRCGFVYNPDLLRSLASDESLRYEPDPHGLRTARESIAEYYRRKGVATDPANIFVTASTSEAYSYLFRLFCNPGEKVFVPRPSYPLFEYLCTINDVEPCAYRLSYDDEWHIGSDAFREVDELTKLILLVHPNNPTGSFVKQDERELVLGVAAQRRLALVVDEVFGEFGIGESNARAGSFAGETTGLVCTLGGVSKLLGLPQIKLAWIVLSGDDALVREARGRLEIIADTYLSVSTPSQHALPALFREGPAVTDQIRARITANHRSLQDALAGSAVSLLKTEGGWSAILRLPRIASDEAWSIRLLKECNVLVHPGHFFEMEPPSCIVVSLLQGESVFRDGIDRIAGLVRSV